jgi:NADPH:quinone reductase-like Zn-dependent oxidoreductase
MKAAVVSSFDAPPTYGEFPAPELREGETLVTVKAAALHQIVRSVAKGTHYSSTGVLPFVPGVDGAGVLADGQRVYFGAARPPYGTMAEQTIANSMIRIPLPDGIDDVTAAGIANPAMSSWVALTARAKFQAGESVLVLGATGASGLMAVQIAKRRGAGRVVAAGRNRAALEEASRLGADATVVLDGERDAVVAALREQLAAGVDVVLDYVWGSPAEMFFEAMSTKGLHASSPRVRYVQIGNMADATIALPAAVLRSTGLEIVGSGFGSASFAQIAEALGAFFAEAAREPFSFATKAAPLREVEALWNAPDEGARLVFHP